jgi:hypothetical protein
MKLNKNKKGLLTIFLNFLIADYSSWNLLGYFVFNQQKSNDILKIINKLFKETEKKTLDKKGNKDGA